MKQGDLVQLLKDREHDPQFGTGALSRGDGLDPAAAKAASGLVTSTGYTPLTDVEYWNIFRQVSAGIRYLHRQNVIHGDIKPQVRENRNTFSIFAYFV